MQSSGMKVLPADSGADPNAAPGTSMVEELYSGLHIVPTVSGLHIVPTASGTHIVPVEPEVYFVHAESAVYHAEVQPED